MKFIAVALCLFVACDDGEPSDGPIERACNEVADRFCCGLRGDDAVNCYFIVKADACFLGHVAGRDELYQQSSVDFAACNAALDEAPAELCEPSCVFEYFAQTGRRCFDLPQSCISANCEENPDACVVDDVPFSP